MVLRLLALFSKKPSDFYMRRVAQTTETHWSVYQFRYQLVALEELLDQPSRPL
jgi:hypothetical protein